MEEEAGDQDGEPLSARDAAAVGDGFLDQLCPLLVLHCGENSEGAPVPVQALCGFFWPFRQRPGTRPLPGAPCPRVL